MTSDKQPPRPATPTLDSVNACRGRSAFLRGFLEWLQENYDPETRVVDLNHKRILHEFFEIDENEVENEREALLDWQRKLNEIAAEKGG